MAELNASGGIGQTYTGLDVSFNAFECAAAVGAAAVDEHGDMRKERSAWACPFGTGPTARTKRTSGEWDMLSFVLLL